MKPAVSYKKLPGVKFTPADFAETLDGGQAFRWDDVGGGEYFGVFGKNWARLRLACDGSLEYSSNAGAKVLAEYFDAARDYESLRKNLKSRGDGIVDRALEIYPTLRILRQNPAEALICFICSSSKRIVQIKQCVRLLSENLGDEICDGVYALPEIERIADADISVLRKCKLGFRAEYLKRSAAKISADKFDPMELREMPYAEAKKYLIGLSGIGEKVADCILLFGASRFEAFPVDTWIRRAMVELYSTPDNPACMRDFALKKFGPHAGFAQQLIFTAKRKNLL